MSNLAIDRKDDPSIFPSDDLAIHYYKHNITGRMYVGDECVFTISTNEHETIKKTNSYWYAVWVKWKSVR